VPTKYVPGFTISWERLLAVNADYKDQLLTFGCSLLDIPHTSLELLKPFSAVTYAFIQAKSNVMSGDYAVTLASLFPSATNLRLSFINASLSLGVVIRIIKQCPNAAQLEVKGTGRNTTPAVTVADETDSYNLQEDKWQQLALNTLAIGPLLEIVEGSETDVTQYFHLRCPHLTDLQFTFAKPKATAPLYQV